MAKRKKIRANFRKNRSSRAREGDLTRDYEAGDTAPDDAIQHERVSGKGELTRKRTVHGTIEEDASGTRVQLDVNTTNCLFGTVLSVHGLASHVYVDDGRQFRCATRRLLKTLNTDQRHVVATGDRVLIRVANEQEAIIERVESRYGCISRRSRGRQHVIVTNVDQLLIITSAGEPGIKPNLIDRMLVTAERSQIRPVICVNKVDLINPADLQPLVGVYGQMGYQVVLLSATTGFGVAALRRLVAGKKSAVAGQSGVGKSSLLNSIQAGLHLRVRAVSTDNDKGRHTTTAATLVPLDEGGFIVDTPGIRSFQLWDIIPEEVSGYFRDIRPFVSHCRYPDCTHTHEQECAVKDAVADNHLDARRYESYCQMHADA